ncbi:MAG TPA: hypothetical protein ACFYD3_09935 [Candidatus Hypogeohydataceae bacterium YC41]
MRWKLPPQADMPGLLISKCFYVAINPNIDAILGSQNPPFLVPSSRM